MNEEEKWNYIVCLDEELLKGGIIISEYVAELIRNADISFVYGADINNNISCCHRGLLKEHRHNVV